MRRTNTARRCALTLGTAAALVLSMSACGSEAPRSANTPPGDDEVHQAVIATGPPGTYYVPLYVAEAKGLFEEENVDVEIVNLSSTAVSELIAGRADLVAYGAGASFAPVNQGKDVKLVFALSSYLAPGFMFALPDVEKPADCKNIVTYAAGGISHTLALTYNKEFNAGAEVQPMTDQGAIYGTITSGRADCYVGPYPPPKVIEQGHLKMLIDVRVPSQLPSSIPQSGAGTSLWGVADGMEKNRKAITRVLAAVSKACDVIAKSSAKEIAQMLKSTPHFAEIDVAAIESTAGIDGEMACPDDGNFPEAGFAKLLSLYKVASPFIDTSASTWTWAERVDHSYRRTD